MTLFTDLLIIEFTKISFANLTKQFQICILVCIQFSGWHSSQAKASSMSSIRLAFKTFIFYIATSTFFIYDCLLRLVDIQLLGLLG